MVAGEIDLDARMGLAGAEDIAAKLDVDESDGALGRVSMGAADMAEAEDDAAALDIGVSDNALGRGSISTDADAVPVDAVVMGGALRT